MTAATPSSAASGRAALVIDGNTGQDLHARDAERPLYPASLTKMMTLYIVFDMLEQKRLSFSTKMHVTQRCASQPPSNLDLQADSTLSLRDAVLALVVKSANDVACAIGENLAGSEEKFAQIMTAKARQIGMRATTFRNASGLPDPGQVTTARDMATLALRLAHDFPDNYKLFSTREFTFNGHTHRSHNGLLHNFEGTDGIKTGYTRASGFNLVSSVRRGEKHVIGVVMGGLTAAQRNATMRGLLTQGLGRAKAMARPILQKRPSLVAQRAPVAATEAGVPDKAPVPRRVAEARVPARSEAVRSDAVRPEPAGAPEPIRAVAPVVAPAAPVKTQAAPIAKPQAQTSAAQTSAAQTSGALGLGLGRPPATFQDQAGAPLPLAGASLATPIARPSVIASKASAPPPAGAGLRGRGGVAAGPFHVQIGAFSTEAEAQKQITAVSERAGKVLAGHAPVTVPVAKANVQFYRARFAGFDEAKAQATCQSLKAQKMECVVMRAE